LLLVGGGGGTAWFPPMAGSESKPAEVRADSSAMVAAATAATFSSPSWCTGDPA
jgi:hypothetical protein